MMKENFLLRKDRTIKTLKSRVYKYITSISKNVYIDKLDGHVRIYFMDIYY